MSQASTNTPTTIGNLVSGFGNTGGDGTTGYGPNFPKWAWVAIAAAAALLLFFVMKKGR